MSKRLDKDLTVVIPAFNEERGISRVLDFALSLNFVGEIIVVDDGSEDKTAQIVKSYVTKGVILITLDNNIGKTWALAKGVETSTFPNILTLDGDLLGLNVEDFTEGWRRYKKGYSHVIINAGGHRDILTFLMAWFPGLSGMRFFDKEFFNSLPLQKKDRFQLETRMNESLYANSIKYSIVNARELRGPVKFMKFSNPIRGIYLFLKMGIEVWTTHGVWGGLKQLAIRWRMRTKMWKEESLNAQHG